MATSSVTRMTNVSGLIDVDSLVEAQMLRYKTKINTAKQNKMVEEYKQEQYREITTKAKTFYDKYFTSSGEKSLVKNSAYNTIKFDSSNSSAVTATGSSEANVTNYSVKVTQLASAASYTIKSADLGNTIKVKDSNGNEKEITILGSTNKEKAANINKALEDAGLNATASYSDFADSGNGGFVIQSKSLGKASTITVEGAAGESKEGKNLEAVVTDKNTHLTKTITDADNYTSNSIKLDGVTFNFNDVTNGEEVVLSGKNDATDLADKLESFINDYNDLMGTINTRLYESRDKSYMPLTDEDKEGLTDSQIEKLEKKAQTGLLKNDSYLSQFADDMKLTMSSIMKSSGLSLEKIGIEPVKDYTTQNGLFTVDKSKLKSALEEDPEGVMNLFTKGFTDSSSNEKGLLTKLEANLQYHATGTFSRLANKAGVASGVTSVNNEMSKDITDRKKLISQMESDYTTRENNLYTKYSKLESSLASLQSQQSSLSSYFS